MTGSGSRTAYLLKPFPAAEEAKNPARRVLGGQWLLAEPCKHTTLPSPPAAPSSSPPPTANGQQLTAHAGWAIFLSPDSLGTPRLRAYR